METWFMYAMMSWIFAGLYSFMLSVSAKLNHNSWLVISYSMYLCSFLSLLVFLMSFDFSNLTPIYMMILASIWNAVFYYIAMQTSMDSLRYMDSTMFFPMYKTLWPMLMVIVSYMFFGEWLNSMETLGFMLGMMSPIMLMSKSENISQLELKKWLILLLLGVLFWVMSSVMPKIMTSNSLNLDMFLFMSFIIWWTLWLMSSKVFNKKTKYNSTNLMKMWIFNWVLLFLSVYFFSYATVWNLGMVYTVNSLSFLIPMTLSVYFYKEHFDLKKCLAIMLTVLSLYFMW